MLRTFVFCALASFALTTPARAQLDPDVNHSGLAVEWMYETSGFVSSIAVGDLDGDGFADLVVPDSGAIRVWWNDGNARFDQRTVVVDGQGGSAFSVADVDGDGRNDLIVALSNSGLAVYRGLGGRQFKPPVVSSTSMAFDQIAIADMNRDGRPDVVGVSRTGHGVAVELNARDGAFTSSGSGALDGEGSVLAVADFDGDGMMDVAAAPITTTGQKPSTGIRIFRGDGRGGLAFFDDIEHTFEGWMPHALVAIDLDQDGYEDLLSAASGVLGIHHNDGTGHFSTTSRDNDQPGFPIGIAAARLDPSAPPVVIETAGDLGGTQLFVYEPRRDPLLEHPQRYSSLFFFDYGNQRFPPNQILGADLDADGREDLCLLTANPCGGPGCPFTGSHISIVRTRSDGSLSSVRYQDAPPTSGLRAAHLSAGPADILLFTPAGVERTRLQAGGLIQPPRLIAHGIDAWPLDVNMDGHDDLVIAITPDSLAVRLTGRDGELGPEIARWAGRWIGGGELGGSPGPEIAYLDGTAHVAIAWSQPQHPFSRMTHTDLLGVFGDGHGPEAVDRLLLARCDGQLRLLRLGVEWGRHGEGDGIDTAFVYAIGAGGQVRELARSLIPDGYGMYFNQILAADLDGDDDDELLILRNQFASAASIQVLRSAGSVRFVADETPITITSEGAGPMMTADFDGDGNRDILWRAQNPANNDRFEIAWNDGHAHFTHRWTRHLAHENTTHPVVDDLDGDGRVDVVFAIRPGYRSRDSKPGIGILFCDGRESVAARPRMRTVPARTLAQADDLRLASSNPVGSSSIRVAFTLERQTGAVLELFDLSGRRVLERPVDKLGEGRHLFTVSLPTQLGNGVYWLALRQGPRTETQRITVLR